ncbi:unnamed protein product [Adineta steineri]|uniref:Uncharacterized protein n=1 Tax=Adineta steineri TaxID=433720 RepID=A0A814YJM9_9BILA|nr:unnamed protein product [Adineta steineri]CAF4044118.1 unnamed protein product [Adineta steineri]
MSKVSEPIDFNKSAYVALICLIAFVIVITICILKQFIWDPLLAKRFEVLRPVLSESVRKFSSSFYRPQSTRTSFISLQRSHSDACVKTNDSSLLSAKTLITVTHSLPSDDNQYNPINKQYPPRSYGSSLLNPHVYVNYASDDLNDEQITSPSLQFTCEYNPTTFNINLNIKNLQNMNIFKRAIKPNTFILIRSMLSKYKINETATKPFQDYIHFGEVFPILNNIHPGDALNYEIRFSLILIIDQKTYEIAESIYSMKNDSLTYILFIERTLPMNLKLVESNTK